MNKKCIKISALVIISIVCLLCILSGFILGTPRGNAFILQKILQIKTSADSVQIDDYERNIFSGIHLQDVILTDIKFFPAPNNLKIQELEIVVNNIFLRDWSAKVVNARLTIPHSDPVIISGKVESGNIDVNVYTNSISEFYLKELRRYPQLANVRVDMTGINLFITGTLNEPLLKGDFFIERLDFNEFQVRGCQGQVDMKLQQAFQRVKPYGSLFFRGGTLQGQRTALIYLDEARVLFLGAGLDPNLNITMHAKVKNVKMSIKGSGSVKKPDIYIQSEPQLSQERLLAMIATNRAWGAADEFFTKGVVSADMVKDIVGYFLFPARENAFLKRFGITDFSVTFDEGRRGVAIEKAVSEKSKVGYGVEQRFEDQAQTETRHTVGAEYQLTDKISVEAEREYKQQEQQKSKELLPEGQKEPETEDTIFLKYKTKF